MNTGRTRTRESQNELCRLPCSAYKNVGQRLLYACRTPSLPSPGTGSGGAKSFALFVLGQDPIEHSGTADPIQQQR